MDAAEYRARWAQLHGGYDTSRSRAVRGWLAVASVLARPLVALRLGPNAVTALAVAVAVLALGTASAGGGWLAVAAWVGLLSLFLDGLDGTVAVLTGRASRFGAVLDSTADRVSEAVLFVMLVAAGAPGGLVAAAAAAGYLQEYLRARAGAVGAPAGVVDDVVTVAERPVRVGVVLLATFVAGLAGDRAGAVASAGAAAAGALALVAVLQLAVGARAALREDR